MVLSDEQMQALIRLMGESITKAIGEKKAEDRAGAGGDDNGLDKVFMEKQFMRVEKFEGGDKDWKNWSFDFLTAAKSVNHKIGECWRKQRRRRMTWTQMTS